MTAKLSKPMQDAMWGRGYYELNTARALEKRGLARVRVVYAYGGRTVHLDHTTAGRAWIAEQIEAAHVEALRENLNRIEANNGPEVEAAIRMLGRAGIMVGFSLLEADRAEALSEHARRAHERWDAVAALPDHVCTPVAYELSAALALAARWGVVDCPIEIVRRDEAAAYVSDRWRTRLAPIMQRNPLDPAWIQVEEWFNRHDPGRETFGQRTADVFERWAALDEAEATAANEAWDRLHVLGAWLDMRRAQGCQTLDACLSADYADA